MTSNFNISAIIFQVKRQLRILKNHYQEPTCTGGNSGQVTPPFFHIFHFHKILSHSAFHIITRGKLPTRVCVRVAPSKIPHWTILHLPTNRALHAKYSVSRGSYTLAYLSPFVPLAIKNCYPYVSKVVSTAFFSIFNVCIIRQCFTELSHPWQKLNLGDTLAIPRENSYLCTHISECFRTDHQTSTYEQ